MNNMADRYKERHELDAAATTAREAIRVAHDARADDVEALAHSTLAAVYLQTGNVTEAAEEAAAAERLAPDDAPLPVVDAWVVQAEIAAGASDWSRADHFFRKAIARLAELNHRTRLNETALRYSQLLKERGDLEAASRWQWRPRTRTSASQVIRPRRRVPTGPQGRRLSELPQLGGHRFVPGPSKRREAVQPRGAAYNHGMGDRWRVEP